jgi:drug/metabolite transporter (DMT)-like permease
MIDWWPIQHQGRAIMDDRLHLRDARLAVALGAISAGSALSLATYFAVQGPFGTLNDIGTASAGVLSAALAWRLRRSIPERLRPPAVACAMVGGAVVVLGSSLVISGTTGFFLAGLVSSIGYAGIGAWLVMLNRSSLAMNGPRRLGQLGLLAGGLMLLGFLALPGVAIRLDDMATAPGWVWIGQLGWLGIFVAYPAWALWTGVRALRGEAAPAPAQLAGERLP